ncbi:MAG: hypothetical protein IJK85_07345 [Bacteroidales bacterium]|nr:hypothetical protein [Bacteroidales bacterium]
MRYNNNIRRMAVVAALCCCALGMSAQVVDSAHLLIQYVPKLINSNKINRSAVIVDTVQEEVKYTYSISPQKPEVTFNAAEMKVTKLNPEISELYYRNYIKLGFGYPITPLAELSMHNCRNRKYSYGLNFHHFSSWAEPIGKIQKQYAYAPTSDTRVHLFMNRFFKNYTLYTSLGYNHEMANLYGYNKSWGIDPVYYEKDYRDSIHNNFHHLKAELGIRSNYTTEDKRVKEDVRLNYDFIHTYWKDMEHTVGLKSFIAYDERFLKISGYQHYQLDFNVEYYNNHWNDSIYNAGTQHNVASPNVDNSFKVEFRPHMNFTIKEYHILLGVGVPVLMANEQLRCPVYPIAELQLGLVRGLLSIYAGVDGRSEYNSLKNILYENPYVKPQLDSLRFNRTQVSIYGGVKGNLFKKFNYHISARYSYSKDMPFYVLDTNSMLKNQFDIVYAEKVGHLNVCANLSWEAIDHLYLNLNANYWGYYFSRKSQHPEHAWYKPTWEIGFEGKYVLKQKFIFDVNAKVGFDRWALMPVTGVDEAGNTVITGYRTVNDIRKDYDMRDADGKKVFKPILNFGVGFEYIITKHFAAFAQVNNIGCQYASEYLNFNNFGVNALVGVTYSFGNEPLKPAKKKKQ